MPDKQAVTTEVVQLNGSAPTELPSPFDTPISGEVGEAGQITPFFDQMQNPVNELHEEIPNAFTPEEAASFGKWMAGIENEPPALVRRMTKDFASRAGWGLSFMVVDMFARMQHMSRFIRKAEEKLFDPANLDNFPSYGKEIMQVWEMATKAQAANMQFIRQFILQNRDLLDMTSNSDPNPEVTEMVKLLSDLDPVSLQAFKNQLVNTVPETISDDSDTGE